MVSLFDDAQVCCAVKESWVGKYGVNGEKYGQGSMPT